MATTEPPTLDQVLMLATRLPPADKLRLIARLAPQVVYVLSEAHAAPVADDDLLLELDTLIADAADVGPAAHDSADVISQMRR
jgi:hypothetical protein